MNFFDSGGYAQGSDFGFDKGRPQAYDLTMSFEKPFLMLKGDGGATEHYIGLSQIVSVLVEDDGSIIIHLSDSREITVEGAGAPEVRAFFFQRAMFPSGATVQGLIQARNSEGSTSVS